MGLISGKNAFKDIFNSTWITAIICTAGDRMFFVPIKYTIGDYFLAVIERELYCFKLVGHRVKTFKTFGAKTFRAIIYDTAHYMPVSASDQKNLEVTLRKSGLPKVSNRLYGILKFFSKKEHDLGPDEPFTPHELAKITEQMEKHSAEYSDEILSIQNYLEHLGVESIVTPVKKVTEYLDMDFLATDPRYFGTMMSLHLNLEIEHKKLTNTPINAKKPYIKFVILMLLVVMLVVLVYYAYSTGTFSHILPTFNSVNTSGQPNDMASLLQKYPKPEDLKAAIARGEVNYDALPDNVKKMVDAAKTPQVITVPPSK